MSRHHSRKSKSLSWMDIADLFTMSARLITRFTIWSNNLINGCHAAMQAQHYALNAQRLENLRLDAQNKHTRGQKLSNDVVVSDARAELEYRERMAKIAERELKIIERREKLRAAGVFAPDFKFENYPEPGDVRRGIMPPAEEQKPS